MGVVRPLLVLSGILIGSAVAQETIRYDFNNFKDGPIDGQMEWNVYEKVSDSSALSIMDELGTSEAKGDKALVVRSSLDDIRCVTGEPLRWLPGSTLSMEFDFKLAVESGEIMMDKPVLTVLIGDALLSEKARWSLQIEAMTNGDWRVVGGMPDEVSEVIYAENFLLRIGNETSISEWHTLKLVVEKLSEPDSFETHVQIQNSKSGKALAEVRFTDKKKDKVTASMWNTSRAHVGFQAAQRQLGIFCIDNLRISSAK